MKIKCKDTKTKGYRAELKWKNDDLNFFITMIVVITQGEATL